MNKEIARLTLIAGKYSDNAEHLMQTSHNLCKEAMIFLAAKISKLDSFDSKEKHLIENIAVQVLAQSMLEVFNRCHPGELINEKMDA